MKERMATPANPPKNDLASLHIDDAQRKRSNVGKRLALLSTTAV